MKPTHTAYLFLIALTLSWLTLAEPAGATPRGNGVWPLDPRPEVVRGFELPAKAWLPGHRGLDLAGSPGQPVLSATAGIVTYAGQLAGRGVVVITQGPTRTTYEPVIPTLPTGTPVTPGTTIGHLSAAGTHCPPQPCLHWGYLAGPQYLNPLSLLSTQPVRLLPLANHARPPDGVDFRSLGLAPQATAITDPTAPVVHPPTPPAAADLHNASNRGGELVARIVVGLAAAGTALGSLLIRRH
jgi:hypothetical protein